MRLKVLNATWVEVAEVDVRECAPACSHTVGWHWSHAVALLCFAVIKTTVMPT